MVFSLGEGEEINEETMANILKEKVGLYGGADKIREVS